MDILGQSALLVSVTSFAIGFSVLARNVRNILFISFATVTVLISMWALAFFLEKIWPDLGFYRLHLFFNIWLAPASLTFIRVMIRIQDGASQKLSMMSVVLAFCLSIALLLQMENVTWILQMIYFSPGLVVLQTMRLMWIDRRLKLGAKRVPKVPTVGLARRNLIYLGALLVLATSVMDHVPWMGSVLPALGNLALTVYIFFLSQAITQQRLLNISALFSRFLVLLSVAFTLTILYSMLVAWIENSPGLFFLNSFIASFLILNLLDPLRALVGYFTQRLLSAKHRRLQQVLRDAQRRLTGIVDLGTLFQAILSVVEQTLEPGKAVLYVLRSDGTKFRKVREIGRDHSDGVKEVLVNHPLLVHSASLANRGQFPILLDQMLENEKDRSASRLQREQFSRFLEGLRALESNLLIPLIDGGRMLGFVSVRAISPPEPWGNNWGLLPILYPYFEQAAQTMQNMEVYVRQREKERLAAIGEMAAGLAHEIRNPLGAIKGAVQYLDPSTDRPESRFLNVILEEVDRLNRVVTQFLDYSKPASTDLKDVDLSELIEKTVDWLKPSLRAGISVEFLSPQNRPLVVASEEQIRQVLINLIQNAQNALEERQVGGSILIGINSEEEQALGEVVFYVEDNGKGIKKEHFDKLFIPFFTTSPKGTGLGLSICHKIIEAHKGRIEITSEEGRFTRVSVVLPLAKEA